MTWRTRLVLAIAKRLGWRTAVVAESQYGASVIVVSTHATARALGVGLLDVCAELLPDELAAEALRQRPASLVVPPAAVLGMTKGVH